MPSIALDVDAKSYTYESTYLEPGEVTYFTVKSDGNDSEAYVMTEVDFGLDVRKRRHTLVEEGAQKNGVIPEPIPLLQVAGTTSSITMTAPFLMKRSPELVP